jgi:alpha-glucosidase
MARTSFLQASAVLASFLSLTHAQASQSATPTNSGWSTTLNGTPTSFRSVFTIPASADVGADVLPNIQDPKAVNAQDVCPGYKASQLQQTDAGISAVLTLAGAPCNVYGTDIEILTLKVEYQSKDRLAVNIRPAHLDASNSSQWVIPESLIPRPQPEGSHADLDLKFDWANEPSFWFSVTRQSTGDVVFTTKSSHLVYENQFVEFVNSLPEDYNLYGLGERIHGLRLNNR